MMKHLRPPNYIIEERQAYVGVQKLLRNEEQTNKTKGNDVKLEELGFTKEEILNKTVDRIVDQIMTTTGWDPEDNSEYAASSQFSTSLQRHCKEAIDKHVSDISEKHIVPKVAEAVEKFKYQECNNWGEKKGKELSFIEYMEIKAENYMQEEVDYNGKRDSWNDGKRQSRLCHIIEEYIQYEVKRGVESATSDMSKQLEQALGTTLRLKLAEISDKIKVAVKV